MTTENIDFELSNKNINEWISSQFWESDPMQNNQSLCDIILYVNWKTKEVSVETQMRTNSVAGEVWHHTASEYTIPYDTDFTEFKEFYDSEVKPIIQEIGVGFESVWNGSNWVGKFESERDLDWKVEETLQGSPSNDTVYSFDVIGTFNGKHHLEEYLSEDDINFREADLDNDETLSKIIKSIESGDVVILNMDNEDYRNELKEIQEELREEE